MFGLLGSLAAGAAMGARDASNQSTAAQNALELDQQREQLREHFLNERFNKQRAVDKEDAAAQGLLNQANYERDRANKLADTDAEHKRRLEILGMEESGRNTRLDKQIAAAKKEVSGSTSDKKSPDSITLDNGTEFVPNDADSKNAVNMVKLGLAKNLPEAYQKIYARGFSSQAAGSVQGLTEGAIPTALGMSKNLLNNEQAAPQQNLIKEWNPKTGRFE